MRLCMAGTRSPVYPAILRSVFTNIAFRGSNPKLLCIDCISPRTATSEDVTSTAQMETCITSSTSRAFTRRPELPAITPADPALTTSYGLVRKIWRTGTAPKRKPLAKASNNAAQ
jgi:hypothetical protein